MHWWEGLEVYNQCVSTATPRTPSITCASQNPQRLCQSWTTPSITCASQVPLVMALLGFCLVQKEVKNPSCLSRNTRYPQGPLAMARSSHHWEQQNVLVAIGRCHSQSTTGALWQERAEPNSAVGLECSFGLHFVQCCTDVAAVGNEIKPQFSKIYPESVLILGKFLDPCLLQFLIWLLHMVIPHGTAPAAPPHLQGTFASGLINTRTEIDGNWNCSWGVARNETLKLTQFKFRGR